MLTSKQIATKYKVSLRTAQRWIKQGFNEAMHDSGVNEVSCDHSKNDKIRHQASSDVAKETTNNTNNINNKILSLLEAQNKLIDNQNQLMQTMLELMIELKNDRPVSKETQLEKDYKTTLGDLNTTINDKQATQNDKAVATPNTSKILALEATNVNLEGQKTTINDSKRHELSPSVALMEKPAKEKEEKNKEKFPLIYPPYKETKKEEKESNARRINKENVVLRQNLNPTIPLVECDKIKSKTVAEDKKTANKVTSNPIKPKTDYEADFLEFWELYPRRATDSKYKTHQAYQKAKQEKSFNQEQLLLAVENYKKLKAVQDGYQKGAAVFLNQKMYQEEHLIEQNVMSYKTQKEAKKERVSRVLDLYNQVERLEAIENKGDIFIEAYGFNSKEDIRNAIVIIRNEINQLHDAA